MNIGIFIKTLTLAFILRLVPPCHCTSSNVPVSPSVPAPYSYQNSTQHLGIPPKSGTLSNSKDRANMSHRQAFDFTIMCVEQSHTQIMTIPVCSNHDLKCLVVPPPLLTYNYIWHSTHGPYQDFLASTLWFFLLQCLFKPN